MECTTVELVAGLAHILGLGLWSRRDHRTLADRVVTRTRRNLGILEVRIGPESVDWEGVDWPFLSDVIEGFEDDPGYRYAIRMDLSDVWRCREKSSRDASRYGDRLIEILGKVQEP